MSQPTAAMLVIGDEILSGRTRDANAHHLARTLTQIGVRLTEIRMVGDEHEEIVAAVNALRGRVDHLFTSGGIGPTHDDITGDAVAAAFGVPIGVRGDALAILQDRYKKMGTEINAARLRMARIPDGASLIENPISGAPGFTLGNVHVLAGVPVIFEAMLETLRPSIQGGPPILSHTFRCMAGEGDLAIPFGEVAEAFPDVAMGSYPFGGLGAMLVLRTPDRVRLEQAAKALRKALKVIGGADSETGPDEQS